MIDLIEEQAVTNQINAQQTEEAYYMVYQVLDKVVFEMSTSVNEQDHMQTTIQLLLKVVKRSALALENLINNRVLEGVIDPPKPK